MKKKEKNALIRWIETLSDSELLMEYYDSVLESCGSQCEEMYDMGFDISEILLQEEYEKYVAEKTGILEACCLQRGLLLWE